MTYIKQVFTRFNSQILLTTGLLYTGFTLGTIIDSAHKYEVKKLKVEISNLKST